MASIGLKELCVAALAGIALAGGAAAQADPDGDEGPQRKHVARIEAGYSAAYRAATFAVSMVGKPYRTGGAAPSTGFDCSGLVQFSFWQAGVRLPRRTDEQREAGGRVRVSNLRPGDLVFFDLDGRRNSHVGIYVGNGQFVHAPSTGKRVRKDRVDSPYWRKRLSEVRRFDAIDA
jgi:cell wall-associated NlpC family hydrolase